MSLSDTAEYLQDVKAKSSRIPQVTFVHIANANCGHYKPHTGNTKTSKYIGDINCYACKAILAKKGNVFGLIAGRENKSTQHHASKIKCSCGAEMVMRRNKSTGEKFYGCSQYPKCKKTKSIKH